MQTYLNTPPFDTLSHAEKESLARHTKIVYAPDKTPLPKEWQGDFFVILKGGVHEKIGDELIAGLHPYDWFEYQEVATFVPSEEVLLLRIEGKAVRTLAKDNDTLQKLLFAELPDKIAEHERRTSVQVGQSLLHNPISDLGEHIKAPVFVAGDDTLYQAVVTMNAVKAKHVLVQDGERVGMFTQADVCRAIGEGCDFNAVKVRTFSRFELKTIAQSSDVSDALLLMVSHKIHRLPIVDDGQIVGVIGQSELLSYLSHHSELIATRIEQATSLDELSEAVAMVGKFIRTQHRHGTKVYVISRMVQSLNLHIFSKVWSLVAPSELLQNSCVIVMGSEGRGEQIMRTDQDNALIIDDNFYHDKLDDFANTFNEHLEMFGYPLCRGNMMMRCAVWRLPLSKFQAQIKSWYTTPQDDSLIWLSTLLDAQFVCGNKALFDRLYASIFDNYFKLHSSNFINRFALPVIQMGDQTTFWQKFTGEKDSDIDLKKAGIFPIVHGTKTLCLQHNIRQNTTKERLYWLAKMGVIDDNLAKNSLEALNFFLTKRLQVALTTSDKSARRVNPNTLSNLERDLLKQSLQVVKTFKSFMVHYYRLDIFGSS